MASERMIDLSPSELLAEQLRALGVDPSVAGPSIDDRVLCAYADAIREEGRLVSASEVSARIGVKVGTVQSVCRRLRENGRMLVTMNPQTSRVSYVPVVKP